MKKSDEEVQSIVSHAVDEAVSFISSEITPLRKKAIRYFQGECDLEYEKGRSKVVATKCRDAVRQVKPSLMRIFMYANNPVEFLPMTPADVGHAEQATKFIKWKFNEVGGFMMLNSAFHDALVSKMGIIKVVWEERARSTIHMFEGLDDDMFQLVVEDPDTFVLEHDEYPDPDPPPPPPAQPGEVMPMEPPMLHDVKVVRSKKDGDMALLAIPPEEFIVNSSARCLEDAYIIGHRRNVRMADAIRMGFKKKDLEDLSEYSSVVETNEEDEERRGYIADWDEADAVDEMSRLVGITEAYMYLSVPTVDVPIHHRITVGGTGNKLLGFEPVDELPFAVFEVDPEPHAFFGRSLVDLVLEDQDACTSMERGILDNVHMTNNPRLGVIEGQVNIGDALNGEIGALVRMTQAGSIYPIEVPFTAGSTIPMLGYMDEQVDRKTGVSRASVGLDPDALQSTTKAAVTATVQSAQGQVEVMARNLAEGGMKRLFSLMLRTYTRHVRDTVMMNFGDEFIPVDPRTWTAEMRLRVNVGLGTGREEEKGMALDKVMEMQMGMLQQGSPLVSLTNLSNALSDRLAAVGLFNAERYFNLMTPEAEQKLNEQQAQEAQNAPPPPPDPYVEAQQIKTQAQMASDQQKAQIDMMRLKADDDLKRDQMEQDAWLKAADLLATHGIKLDLERLKMMQAAPRPPSM